MLFITNRFTVALLRDKWSEWNTYSVMLHYKRNERYDTQTQPYRQTSRNLIFFRRTTAIIRYQQPQAVHRYNSPVGVRLAASSSLGRRDGWE